MKDTMKAYVNLFELLYFSILNWGKINVNQNDVRTIWKFIIIIFLWDMNFSDTFINLIFVLAHLNQNLKCAFLIWSPFVCRPFNLGTEHPYLFSLLKQRTKLLSKWRLSQNVKKECVFFFFFFFSMLKLKHVFTKIFQIYLWRTAMVQYLTLLTSIYKQTSISVWLSVLKTTKLGPISSAHEKFN